MAFRRTPTNFTETCAETNSSYPRLRILLWFSRLTPKENLRLRLRFSLSPLNPDVKNFAHFPKGYPIVISPGYRSKRPILTKITEFAFGRPETNSFETCSAPASKHPSFQIRPYISHRFAKTRRWTHFLYKIAPRSQNRSNWRFAVI